MTLKEKIKQLGNHYLAFNLKHFLTIFLFLFVYLWLREPITDLFDKSLVKLLSSTIPNKPLGFWLGSMYILLTIIVGRSLFRKYKPKNYIPTSLLISSLLFVGILYLYERIRTLCNIQPLHYSFWPIFDGETLKKFPVILDPIFILIWIFSIGYIAYIFYSNKLENNTSLINTDEAIKNKIDDEFERKVFVEKFSERLKGLKIKETQSFVIGINGNWGYGKTSLLKMIANELNKDVIKIEFNPWISTNDYNLIMDFFNTLEDKLSKYIATSNLFKKYGESLTKIDNEKNPFKSFTDFFKDKPLKKKFEDLTSLIRKIHKPVYVFIDDIDRLNKDEVFDILRLIRSSACFPNMIFIIAYDRLYIEKALRFNKIPNSNKYLEKIIQLEIKLPTISEPTIKNVFVNTIKEQIKKTNLSTSNEFEAMRMVEALILGNGIFPTDKKYSINEVIAKLFHNKRDIIQFCNSFCIKLALFHDQIYLPDLFILELIKFYVPRLYDKISVIGDNYAVESKQGTALQVLSLYKNNSTTTFMHMANPQLMLYIDKQYANSPKLNNIKILIEGLISEPLNSDPNKDYGIYYEDYYESYFTLVLPSRLVSLSTIQSLITGP